MFARFVFFIAFTAMVLGSPVDFGIDDAREITKRHAESPRQEEFDYKDAVMQEINSEFEVANRMKRELIPSANVDDFDSVLTVKNHKLGTSKIYRFKKELKIVNGEKYNCIVGVNGRNVIFYHRCLLIPNDSPIHGVVTNDGKSSTDFFDNIV